MVATFFFLVFSNFSPRTLKTGTRLVYPEKTIKIKNSTRTQPKLHNIINVFNDQINKYIFIVFLPYVIHNIVFLCQIGRRPKQQVKSGRRRGRRVRQSWRFRHANRLSRTRYLRAHRATGPEYVHTYVYICYNKTECSRFRRGVTFFQTKFVTMKKCYTYNPPERFIIRMTLSKHNFSWTRATATGQW